MKPRGRIFMCYRRETGADLAARVRESLRERGFEVFMDVEDLKRGLFNEALLREIEAATDVVVILTPGSMERCLEDGDWLRWEVAHAIACDKNVVPVATRGFSWPSQPLPDDLKQLPYFQGIEPSHDLFRASMDKLVALLNGRPRVSPLRRARPAVAAIAIATVAVLAAGLILVRPKPPDENDVLGRQLCFQQNKWEQGVALLAASKGPLRDAAAAEMEYPGRRSELELARQWVAAGNVVHVPDKWHCYLRARHWFAEALKRPEVKSNASSLAAVTAELERVPTLRATLRLKGESQFKEQIFIGPAAIRWLTESGAGPYEILAMKTNLPAFTFERGKADRRIFRTRDFLPEGIDITSARVLNARFGGATGQHASQKLEPGPTGRGVVLRIEEENPRGTGYEGNFTFDIVVAFGH